MDGNCPPPTAAHREAGPDFPSQVFIGRTHPCEPWPPPGLRKHLLQKGRIKCPLLHCRFLSWQEAQEAWPQALETLRDVPSSSLRAAVGTSGAGLVGLQGAEQEGGPRGGGCRRLRSWLLAPGLWLRPGSKSQAGSVPSGAPTVLEGTLIGPQNGL